MVPAIPGVFWWTAILIAVVPTAIAAILDPGSTASLGKWFRIIFVIASVAAVLAVRRRALFTAAFQPPLVLFGVGGLVLYIRNGDQTLQSTVLKVIVPIASGFPLVVGTLVATIAIAAVRWWITRRGVQADAVAARRQAARRAAGRNPNTGTTRPGQKPADATATRAKAESVKSPARAESQPLSSVPRTEGADAAETKPVPAKSASQRTASPQSTSPRSAKPRSTESRSANSRSANSRSANSPSADSRSSGTRSSGSRAAKSGSTKPESAKLGLGRFGFGKRETEQRTSAPTANRKSPATPSRGRRDDADITSGRSTAERDSRRRTDRAAPRTERIEPAAPAANQPPARPTAPPRRTVSARRDEPSAPNRARRAERPTPTEGERAAVRRVRRSDAVAGQPTHQSAPDQAGPRQSASRRPAERPDGDTAERRPTAGQQLRAGGAIEDLTLIADENE